MGASHGLTREGQPWADSERAERAQLTALFNQSVSGRMCGKRMTSRIEGESVKNMTSRSIPTPSPAVGGIPYSSARM
jgi:hypothetical protein